MSAAAPFIAQRQSYTGRRNMPDAARIFPTWRAQKTWLYAVGYADGRIKVGYSRDARDRIHTHYADSLGGVLWAHVFHGSSDVQVTRDAERFAIGKLSKIGHRIGRTEHFEGVSREQAMEAIREAVRDSVGSRLRSLHASGLRGDKVAAWG